jgi:hypothetical protein
MRIPTPTTTTDLTILRLTSSRRSRIETPSNRPSNIPVEEELADCEAGLERLEKGTSAIRDQIPALQIDNCK